LTICLKYDQEHFIDNGKNMTRNTFIYNSLALKLSQCKI